MQPLRHQQFLYFFFIVSCQLSLSRQNNKDTFIISENFAVETLWKFMEMFGIFSGKTELVFLLQQQESQ